CGYHCEAHDEDAACANTPDGACASSALSITCFDPPPASYYCGDGKPLPRASCIMLNDEIACGYGCLARDGKMQCALTPGGKCFKVPTGIACADGEPPVCGVSSGY